MRYRVKNTVSGLTMGVYDAATEEHALEMLAWDAGADSFPELCERTAGVGPAGETPEEREERIRQTASAIKVERASVVVDEAMMGAEWKPDDDLQNFAEILAEVTGIEVRVADSTHGGDARGLTEEEWNKALDLYYEERDDSPEEYDESLV